jgi:DNA (cytosine-5)-methyltransferase 1
MYTHVALFAGLGGFIIAGNRNGFRTVFANEIEEACGIALKQNFPDTTRFIRDVRELNPQDFAELNEDIDVLSAGFPCQSFSVAGDNLGFEDERGKLFFEIPRICSQMNRFPKVLFLENVPHLKVFDGGARLKTVLNELRKIGYWVSESNVAILDSYDYGNTPQRRDRLYIVAVHSNYFRKNKFKFPAPHNFPGNKNLWNYVRRDQKADSRLYLDRENKYSRMITRAAESVGTNRLFQIRRTEARACPENICPTLTANMGGGGHNVPFVIDSHGVRRLSVDEVSALQCLKDNEFRFPAGLVDSTKLSMLGNAVCIDVVDQIFKEVRKLLNEVYADDYETVVALS